MKNKTTLAITGHRDIIGNKALQEKVKNYLENIIEKNIESELVLLSPLADGADRFVAKIFLDLQESNNNLKLIVPLPYNQERYMQDFDEVSTKEFLKFLTKTDSYFEVEHKTKSGYLDVGRYVVDEADILLALWDGTFNGKVGGTGDIVDYAKGQGVEVMHFVCVRKEALGLK